MNRMNHILLLTRNVLVEQELQKKLQGLGYEVYCSSDIFDLLIYQQKSTSLFHFFQSVILSETICEAEVQRFVSVLKDYPISIIRKVDESMTVTDQKYLEDNQINAIITTNDSVDELRECLYQLSIKNTSDTGRRLEHVSSKVETIRPVKVKGVDEQLKEQKELAEVLQRLTGIETKILRILIEADGQIVNRADVCLEIWQDGVNDSHKASLSNTVSKIKAKFSHLRLKDHAIETVWGKGYCINHDLLDRIKNEKAFSEAISIA